MAYVRASCDLARNEMYGGGYEINLKGRGAASDHRTPRHFFDLDWLDSHECSAFSYIHRRELRSLSASRHTDSDT